MSYVLPASKDQAKTDRKENRFVRKVVLQMSVSLDGYLGGAGVLDDDLTAWVVNSLHQTGTHIMGRVTYHEMAAHWPTSTEEFAPLMNTLPKVVFSKTLEKADWPNTQVVRGDTAKEIHRLKEQPGKDILAHGGAGFAQSLSKLGLVDEYRLLVHPVVSGMGSRLFPDLPDPLNLQLLSARPFPSGIVVLVYEAVHRVGEVTDRGAPRS
jgi:dihydrofolate reductase